MRPSKIIRPDLVERVVAAVERGCTHEAACSAGPISAATFYEWMRRGELDHAAGIESGGTLPSTT